MTHELVSTNGNAVGRSAVSRLEARFGGRLIRPGDFDYETARRVWNGMIDRHPGLIARCAGASDVVRVVNFAREHDVLVAVRGGGHNVAGLAVCDNGLVIDLSALKPIEIDSARGAVRAGPGVLLGELNRATQRFSMAVPNGTVSETGMAGLTLGGGLGWPSGKYGLTCTNLIRAEVFSADGRKLVASEEENPDLLWGLRGGGGNFGIVTNFGFRAHVLGELHGGMLVYPAGKAREVMRFYRDFMAGAPDDLTLGLVFVTAPGVGPAVAIVGCYCGPPERADVLLKPLRSFAEPAANMFGPIGYLQLQTMLDAAWAAGYQNYWKSTFLCALDGAAVETIAEHAAAMCADMSAVLIAPFNGTVRTIRAQSCAFVHRGAACNVGIYARWSDPADSDRQVEWVRNFFGALKPFSTGGMYVNEFTSDDGDGWVRDAFGANYDRLVELKNKYDPDNFFRLNHNIKPTRAAARPRDRS